jgi:hypothetical protein
LPLELLEVVVFIVNALAFRTLATRYIPFEDETKLPEINSSEIELFLDNPWEAYVIITFFAFEA